MSVGRDFTRPLQRSRSALTGSPLAGTHARVCLEDSLVLARNEFVGIFQVSEDTSLDAMCWSDNVGVVASSIYAAVHNFQAWEYYLHLAFRMKVKPSSRVIVPAESTKKGERVYECDGLRWPVRDREYLLGSWLTGTGEDSSERLSLCNSWSRAFWMNAKFLMNRRAPTICRAKLWRSICYGLGDFRFAGMRPNKTHGERLEAYNNKFLFRIIGYRPAEGETVRSFCVRRNHAVRQLKLDAKIDVRRRWIYKVTTWIEHLRRHPSCIGNILLNSQGDEWLRERRRRVGKFGRSRTEDAGETATRSVGGFPHRYASTWLEAMDTSSSGFCNPLRSKSKSHENANSLYEFIYNPPAMLALEDAPPLSISGEV